MLEEYLFHMRRAFGQSNRPPPNSDTTFGKVLVYRINRYIGISREGTLSIKYLVTLKGIVSMSWPINEDQVSTAIELQARHVHFQGVYLLLHLHVLGEKVCCVNPTTNQYCSLSLAN
jgi:hypothetical protein